MASLGLALGVNLSIFRQGNTSHPLDGHHCHTPLGLVTVRLVDLASLQTLHKLRIAYGGSAQLHEGEALGDQALHLFPRMRTPDIPHGDGEGVSDSVRALE